MNKVVNIIGAGLAGCEASYQLAKRGVKVRLFEMRPSTLTPAHQGGGMAELVCSNSFKSLSAHNAHSIFKKELQTLGSMTIAQAMKARVPAGESLAVDRDQFSSEVSLALLKTGNIERQDLLVEKLSDLPPADATIIATGPLTHGALNEEIQRLAGKNYFYFYDAIAPIVSAESIDMDIAFSGSRYGKGDADFINCPMNREEYETFYDALMSAEKVDFQDFEEAKYFQGCQPIEAIAATGKDSLRFGPMKPVGFDDPRTGRRPYALVQLRIDNLSRSAYNLVGFQTKLKYGEQPKVFSLIPGLADAEFLRHGSMHRNTYVCSPECLNDDFSFKSDPTVHLAGQITGVEGYTESSAIGLYVALRILHKFGLWGHANLQYWEDPSKTKTFMGALVNHVFHTAAKDFQPVNVHFGLLPADEIPFKKNESRQTMRQAWGERSVETMKTWVAAMSSAMSP